METQVVVIGAGVIGLSIARQFALKGFDVVVLEQSTRFGNGISSRNSEVIHAGMYYEENSFKAQFCVEGNHQLYEYCQRFSIPYKKTGKLIVASSPNETEKLEKILQQSKINKTVPLTHLTQKQSLELEPEIKVDTALFSSSSGIIDSHQLMLCLIAEIQSFNGVISYNSEVSNIENKNNKWLTHFTTEQQPFEISSDFVINASCFSANNLAIKSGAPENLVPKLSFAKGHYFTYKKPSLFKHLIYPIPEDGGLGIHITLDLENQVRFGPDVVWQNDANYAFEPNRTEFFFKKIQSYFPALKQEDLNESYTGVRPKLRDKNQGNADFLFLNSKKWNQPGSMHLLGIESPGLTCCLPIANYVFTELTQT